MCLLLNACSFYKGLQSKAEAAKEISLQLNEINYGVSFDKSSSSFITFLLQLNVGVINPTNERFTISKYTIDVIVDGTQLCEFDEIEQIIIDPNCNNSIDLNLVVNPMNSLGVALKSLIGRDLKYNLKGFIWLDYKGLEIPVRVNVWKDFSL